MQLMHLSENASIHQKYIIGTIRKLTPVYTLIIEQGISEGLFDTPYPKEASEFILTAARFVLDPMIFERDFNEYGKLIKAVSTFEERILGINAGSLTVPNMSILLKDG